MVYIDSAFFGEGNSARNVTKHVRTNIKDGSIDMLADNSIMPQFSITPELEITPDQDADMRDEAEKTCGGGNNKSCIDSQMETLRRKKFEELAVEGDTSNNIIKGRKLTVNIVNDDGTRKTIIVPDGQRFQLKNSNLVGDPSEKGKILPTPNELQDALQEIGLNALYWAFQIFGVAATFILFATHVNTYVAWILAIIAFMIPMSGYWFILAWFAFQGMRKAMGVTSSP